MYWIPFFFWGGGWNFFALIWVFCTDRLEHRGHVWLRWLTFWVALTLIKWRSATRRSKVRITNYYANPPFSMRINSFDLQQNKRTKKNLNRLRSCQTARRCHSLWFHAVDAQHPRITLHTENIRHGKSKNLIFYFNSFLFSLHDTTFFSFLSFFFFFWFAHCQLCNFLFFFFFCVFVHLQKR